MSTSFLEVKNELTQKYREGYKKRGIPGEICETIWMHSKRAAQACLAHSIGSLNRIIDVQGFPLMGFGHDWVEYDVPDFTPSSSISSQEKLRLESESLERLRALLGEKYTRILDKTGEYLEFKTPDAQEFSYIDKTLAGVGALEYERLGYIGIEDFHPYVLDKLSSNTFHTRIYQILLKREFSTIDYFTQYFLLLRLAGDYESFQKEIENLL